MNDRKNEKMKDTHSCFFILKVKISFKLDVTWRSWDYNFVDGYDPDRLKNLQCNISYDLYEVQENK